MYGLSMTMCQGWNKQVEKSRFNACISKDLLLAWLETLGKSFQTSSMWMIICSRRRGDLKTSNRIMIRCVRVHSRSCVRRWYSAPTLNTLRTSSKYKICMNKKLLCPVKCKDAVGWLLPRTTETEERPWKYKVLRYVWTDWPHGHYSTINPQKRTL